MKPSYTISFAENESFVHFMKQNIKEYNNQNSTPHREARKEGAVQPLHIMVKDGEDHIVGGLTAEIYWNWLEIKDFWLPESYRGMGLGKKILNEAEAIACGKGCKQVFLTTFEFNARTFYEKAGYKIVGKLEDYPPGSCFYWMRKDL